MIIRVTPEQLQELGAQLSGGAGNIDAQLAAMASSLAPLTGGEWAGQASEQFRGLWEQWHESGRRLREALEGVSALLTNAGQAYAQAESSVAATFRA